MPGPLGGITRSLYYRFYRIFVWAWCGWTGVRERLLGDDAETHPLPPPRLRFRVAGSPSRDLFLKVGRRSCEEIEASVEQAGRPLASFGSILDFGCGCGRTLTWLVEKHPAAAFHGTDVDGESIRWCQEKLLRLAKYGDFGTRAQHAVPLQSEHEPSHHNLRDSVSSAEFKQNRPLPPLDYSDGMFDLVYAISVFTHLSEEFQLPWLDELKRILNPKGVLLATVYEESFLFTLLSNRDSSRRLPIHRKGFDQTGLSKVPIRPSAALARGADGNQSGTLGRNRREDLWSSAVDRYAPFAVEDQRPLFNTSSWNIER